MPVCSGLLWNTGGRLAGNVDFRLTGIPMTVIPITRLGEPKTETDMQRTQIIELVETTRETTVSEKETTRRARVTTGSYPSARRTALAKANIAEALQLTARTQARRLGAA